MDQTSTSFWRYCGTAHWEPNINILESVDSFHVCLDVAGVRREDIDVQVQGGNLLVRGHRPVPRPETESQQLRVHHMEIEHGPFCRELELPPDVDPQRIAARYKDGVLWIDLPRQSQ